MALTKSNLTELYRKRAAAYDFSANLYYLIGFRENHYRKLAVKALNLKPGDTIVEIGCGTGLNFKHLLGSVGVSGQIIGVDLTDAMLEQAQDRIDTNSWDNVKLMQTDAAKFNFPDNINGVFSSFALTLVPEYEAVIQRASRSLVTGGRMVILDLKLPENLPMWLIKIAILITRPFGVTLDLSDRKPWLVMQKYFPVTTVKQLFGGFAYIAVGEK